MTKNRKTLITKQRARALGDQTKWSQIYCQSDEETEKKAKSDPDAPELQAKIYTKPAKLNNR